MRKAYEYEQWDRLSFSVAHAAAFAGVKNVDMAKFHKFRIGESNLDVKKLRSLKSKFKGA